MDDKRLRPEEKALARDMMQSLAKIKRLHKQIEPDRFVAIFYSVSAAIVAFETNNEYSLLPVTRDDKTRAIRESMSKKEDPTDG